MNVICNILAAAVLAATVNNPLYFHNLLPESRNVFSITQDDDHNMWFATNTGFYKYDGYNNTRYTFGFFYLIADADRFYRAGVYSDDNGDVWASYRNLYKYDRKSSSFTMIDSIDEEGIMDVVDFNGLMLLACDSCIRAVGRDDLQRKTLDEGLQGIIAYKFFVHEGALYIISKDYRLLRYAPPSTRAEEVCDISFLRGFPVDIDVRDGTVWIASDGGGIASVNSDGKCRRYVHSDRENSLCSDFVRSIAFDSAGNLWASTGNGLSILDKSGNFHSYQPNNESKWSLSKKSLIGIFRDSDDGMWIGNVEGGVDYCSSNDSPFTIISLGEKSDNVIGPVAEDYDRSIWIGTSRSGIFHYYPQDGKYRQFLVSPSSPELNDVKCILVSRDRKYVYFGFARNEIAVLDRESGRLGVNSPFSSSLSILNMSEDRDGNIWMGTSNGIFLYDKESGKAVRAGNQPSSLFVPSIIPDGEDSFLYSACGTLFSCRLSVQPDGPVLSDNRYDGRASSARALVRGVNGELLVSSEDGVTILDGEGARTYTTDDGLSSNSVSSVIRDSNGILWVGTRNGLNMIDEGSGVVKRFFDFDNLPSNYFSEMSCMLSSDGSLYFGTVNGLVRVNPAGAGYAHPSHTPKVAYVSVSGKKLPVSSDGRYMIDPGTSFSVVYGVSNYSSMGRDVFFYRLLPAVSEWTNAGKGNSVTFSNLKHGSYVFEIKSENAYGDPSESFCHINIIVKPFWYQTLLARILYLLLCLLALLYCGVRIRESVSRRYELKIKHVEELSAETILENNARSISSYFLSNDELIFLEKIITTIQNQLQDPLFSVEKLASDMCMSRSNLHRKVKKMTGLSATELLQKFKMEKSADLLSHTEYSVETISEMVGYSSSSYFIQAFKRYYNTTPGKLRQKNE